MNFRSIEFIGSTIPEDSFELCKEMYFKARKDAQKYFLGREVDGTDGLIIKITIYFESGIDDYAEAAPVSYATKKVFPWKRIQMIHSDFQRLVEMGDGGFGTVERMQLW